MSLLAMKKGINQHLWSGGKTFTPGAARTIIFHRENLNYLLVCFTQSTLFFQYVCFLMPVCLPCNIFGPYVTRINAVSWHITWHTFASLCLLTFAPIACLLLLWIKTSNLDRPIRLTQCCTQFKRFGNITFCFRNFHTFKWECNIIMEIQYTKNLNPGRFGLGTTLSYPNRSQLLYLGDAQITREVWRGREGNEKEEKVQILLSFPLSPSCFTEMPC